MANLVFLVHFVPWHWLTLFSDNPTQVMIILGLVGHLVAFWLPGTLLSSFPYFGIGSKLQPKKQTDPLEGMSLVVLNCLIGLLITIPALVMFLPSIRSPLPDAWTICRDVAVFILIEEFLFFHLHYLGHRSSLIYRNIHKLHHRFTSPAAFHVLYTHPVEHILVNLFPLVLGPVLMRSHPLLAISWMSLGQLSSLVAHCGYLIPLIPTNPLHDYHHEHFHGNFGVFGFFDFLYGTLK